MHIVSLPPGPRAVHVVWAILLVLALLLTFLLDLSGWFASLPG